ncbi:MAG: efflux RND transporter periplasmic adaptor subunit [Pseudomonadota bacterium]
MRLWALLLLPFLAVGPALAEPLRFEGTVEASQTAVLSSRLDGIVTDIRFAGGERVTADMPLILMDDADFKLAVATTEADVVRAEAVRALAASEAERIEKLEERGIATDAQRRAAAAGLRTAAADLDSAQVALDRARLDLQRIVIRAPIDGIIGRPNVALGAFLEAEAGAPLGEIVQIDPVLIAYQVPYSARLATIRRTGAESLEELFEDISLTILLPDGQSYPHRAEPGFASPTVDTLNGTLTVWARVQNPDAVLRPGLSVTVISEVAGRKDQP